MGVPILRPFQVELRDDVYQAWNQGAQNVVMRLDTGGGKTVTLSDIIRSHMGWSRVFAHRNELVGQLSLALARNGVRHNLIANDKTKRIIARLHVEALGYSMIDPGARCAVASVDTYNKADDPEAARVTLWVTDEGHHVVRDNKWHRAIERFTHPDCRGLLPTATPARADRKGLGRHAHGIADVMVQGPPMRWLIENGFLSDYRIFCPPSDLQVMADVAASGDWSPQVLKEASQRSHIVGDVVKAYLQYGAGKRGITFTTDIETAGFIAANFRKFGVPTEVITGETDPFIRNAIIRRLERGETQMLVAVDVVSEGFDLPAVEVIIFARPTQSLPLFMQQFGRGLRIFLGKVCAIVIDLVGNVIRHAGPPDKPRLWTLDGTAGKRGASDSIPYRVCVGCFQPYERIYRECPFCGHYPVPEQRSAPGFVDGDIFELSPDVLAALRSEVKRVDLTPGEYGATLGNLPHHMYAGNLNRHRDRQEAQGALRAAMAGWGGARKAEGLNDSQMQRLFFHKFGVDVLTAQGLGTPDALALAGRINSG